MNQPTIQFLPLIYPRTLDEAVQDLKTTLSPEVLEFISTHDERQWLGATHHGIGRMIRNEWNLWESGPEPRDLARWFHSHGASHPDDMSAIILKCIWRDVQGEPRNFEQEVEYYRQYWAKAEQKPVTTFQFEPAGGPNKNGDSFVPDALAPKRKGWLERIRNFFGVR